MAEPRPDDHAEIDYSEQANRAAELRLAGDLDGAEAVLHDIIELGSARAEGYGKHHLGLCARTRAEQAETAGMTELANQFYDEAAVLYDEGFLNYFAAGDYVRASAAMLDQGVLTLRRGHAAAAANQIIESIDFLRTYAEQESDQGFVDEHLGIKYARLAEADLAAQNIAGARKAIDRAKDTPQRNPYFVMVTTEIDGYVHTAEGHAVEAEEALTTAALKADAQGDVARKRRILDKLESLRRTVDAGLPADHEPK